MTLKVNILGQVHMLN